MTAPANNACPHGGRSRLQQTARPGRVLLLAGFFAGSGALTTPPVFAAPTAGEAQKKPSKKKSSKKKSSKKKPSKKDQVRELNRRAQKAYDNNEFQLAADTWSEILSVLPESKANRVERETALLVALDAYTRAWHEGGADLEGDALKEAVARLSTGVTTYEQYELKYKEVYGADAALPEAAAQAGKEIKQWQSEAKDRLPKPPPPPAVDTKPEAQPTPATDATPATASPTTRAGTGLILGGAVTAASGIGAASMIIAGGIMGRRATRDSALAETPEQVDDVNRRGMTGNALVISGAVVTSVLVVAGTTMLILGVQRRNGSLALAPSLGPRSAGATLRLRF